MSIAHGKSIAVDLDKPLVRVNVGGVMASNDKKADQYSVSVTKNGANVDLMGCSVYGYMILPNGETLKIAGAVSGNTASVIIPQSGYAYDGAFTLAVKVSGTDYNATVAIFDGRVVQTVTETIVDGDRVLYGVDEILALIDDMEEAEQAANTAATNANTKATAANNAATAANTAASNANTKATAADTAASAANNAAAKINNMTVAATGLAASATPTATVSEVSGHKHIAFGIPQGAKGDTGATPDLSIGTVTTGAPGTQASATITGTAQEPVLNLTIPRGADGSGSVSTVDGIQPVSGDVPLGAVRYSAAQSLTDSQKQQARVNIGAGKADDMVKSVDGETPYVEGDVHINAVRYTSQTLTASQQTQARSNIGALGASDVVDNLTSDDAAKPLSAKQGKALKTLIDSNPGGGVQTVNSVSPDSNGNVLLTAANVGAIPVSSGAGAHNAIYRGQSLGTSVTSAQWAAISDGTFDGLFIGDYWTIGEVVWRIAAFDYYYLTGDGDTGCTTHHVTIVPDAPLYSAKMNDTDTTVGAYAGTKMCSTNLSNAKTTINSAFGQAHILTHRQQIANAVTNGYESGKAWYDSNVILMTEQNVFGFKPFGSSLNGTNFANDETIDKTQFPLFFYRPDLISNNNWFWLRNVAFSGAFSAVASDGCSAYYYASVECGVRPSFSIKG